eukprot:TRINITY_DN65048_c0_g1_i1.p1 TRINITY_DN65048_c0_g1~~TRINITY_DN65048_c0_g1_i1.p1  ORF type:complete len:148 (-),score=44.26 TRINITY_DN65048_c0_g1_i1:44-487(-)
MSMSMSGNGMGGSMGGGLGDTNASMLTKPPGGKPTGMKGKVHDMAHTLQKQNADLKTDKGDLQTIKDHSQNSSSGMEGQLAEVDRYFKADLQKMQEEFRASLRQQEAENVRLQQQVTQLKCEKTHIHQQILSLQRRAMEIYDEIGHD